MLWLLFLCISWFFAAQASAGWPESRTNTYEVLGGAELGVLIPVADVRFVGRSRASDPIVWLNEYEHVQEPNRRFTLIFDPFDGPCDVDDFTKWCLIHDNFMDMPDFLKTAKMKRKEDLIAGKDIPAIRFTFEYKDLVVEQLFLTVGNYGYCILASYPIKEKGSQSKYWDFFISNTLPWVERVSE